MLPTQAPHAWNLRRLKPGRMLDVGCGIGRNLGNVKTEAVGVDHNPASIAEARRRGYVALTTDEFGYSRYALEGGFDTVLFAHVLEHMTPTEATALVATYLPHLRPGGRVLVILPQEAGYATDPTHVSFVDVPEVTAILAAAGVRVDRSRSFPLPRSFGRWFRYNETVVVGSLQLD